MATPVAAAGLSGTMITAIQRAHWKNGLWSTDGGFEYNLVLLAALAAVTAEERGPGWAVAQLAAGAAGSVAVGELARRAQEPDEPRRPEPAETSWSPAAFEPEPVPAE